MSEDEWTLIKLMAKQLDVQNKMLAALTEAIGAIAQGLAQLQKDVNRDGTV